MNERCCRKRKIIEIYNDTVFSHREVVTMIKNKKAYRADGLSGWRKLVKIREFKKNLNLKKVVVKTLDF